MTTDKVNTILIINPIKIKDINRLIIKTINLISKKNSIVNIKKQMRKPINNKILIIILFLL